MKRTASLLTLVLALLTSAVAWVPVVEVARANPGPATQIPPIVNVPEIQVNATISRVNGTLWARVDAEYSTKTVRAFGGKFQTPNYGFGLVTNPSPSLQSQWRMTG
jgi:hypothetical protein